MSKVYREAPWQEVGAIKIAEVNVAKREYQKAYLEYWNSTRELTDNGRPVDGFISPLAPFAAARPNKYSYYGYSTIINCLDYTSVVIPVTNVDKNVDVIDKSYKPINKEDQEVYEDCKYAPSCKREEKGLIRFQMILKSMMVLMFLFNWLAGDSRRRRCSLWPSTSGPQFTSRQVAVALFCRPRPE